MKDETAEAQAQEEYECILCGDKFEGFGNNAEPLAEGKCCDDCNSKVMRERLKIAGAHPNQTKL